MFCLVKLFRLMLEAEVAMEQVVAAQEVLEAAVKAAHNLLVYYFAGGGGASRVQVGSDFVIAAW